MDLIWLVFGLVLLGGLLEFIKTRWPIDPSILILIRIVIILAVILVLFRMFGKFIPNVLS